MAANGAPRDREGAAGAGDGEARGVDGVREGTRGREGTDGGRGVLTGGGSVGSMRRARWRAVMTGEEAGGEAVAGVGEGVR